MPATVALLVLLFALGLWWMRSPGSRESPAPMADASPATDSDVEALAQVAPEETPPARQAIEPPAPAAPPPTVFPVEVRVLDEGGIPLDAVTVDLWVVPHDIEAAVSGRRLPPTAVDGRSRWEIAPTEVRTGFPMSAEQLDEREQARARGYAAMPVGDPPGDPDVCALRVDARKKGFRSAEKRFEFKLSETVLSGDPWRCEVRLAVLPQGPLLHLTVLEAGTLAPIPGAVLRLAPGDPIGPYVYAVTDRDGRAEQLLGANLGRDGRPTESPATLAGLPRGEGLPAGSSNPGQIRHVLIEHFPDHAPTHYWFHADESFLMETDRHETVLLEPREYLSLRLVDRTTGEPIVGSRVRARMTFYSAHPMAVLRQHGFLDTDLAQEIPLDSTPIRVGLDMATPLGLLVRVERKDERPGSNFQTAYVAHWLDAAEFRTEGESLDVRLAPLRPFTFYLHDLDTPGTPVITRARALFHGSYVAGQLGFATPERAAVHAFDDDAQAFQFAARDRPELQPGALTIKLGWAESQPDLESFTLDRMLISGIGAVAYEIRSKEDRVLAPWAEGENLGRFVPPLAMMADGLPVIGDELGIVHLYVRRKGP